MSWWHHFTRSIVHTVSHPVSSIKNLGRAVVKAEKKVSKGIVKTAKFVAKEGKVGLKVANKAITEVENHAKEIKQVVDVTATVIEVIGVATGQPEIVAGAASLQAVADKALNAAIKARKVVNVAEKTIAIADAIAQKKKLSVILHKTADAMEAGSKLSGNKKLSQIAGHVKSTGLIVDKAIVHAKDVHKIVKDTHKAIKQKDIVGIVKGVEKGIKKSKELKKFKKEVEGSYKLKAKKSLPKAKKVKVETKPIVSTIVVKKSLPKVKKPVVKKPVVKKKRKISAYNLFVKKKRKEGLTMKQISPLWKAEKLKK